MNEKKRTAAPLPPPEIVPVYSGTCILGGMDIFRATIQLNRKSHCTLVGMVLLAILLSRLVYFGFDVTETFHSLLRSWHIVLFTLLAVIVGLVFAVFAASRSKGTLQYAFDEQGLRTACPLFVHHMRWEYFGYWREAADCFGLGTGGRHLIVPKKAFSPEVLDALRNILKEKLPQK